MGHSSQLLSTPMSLLREESAAELSTSWDSDLLQLVSDMDLEDLHLDKFKITSSEVIFPRMKKNNVLVFVRGT